jgi:ribosomal protein L32
LKSFPNRVVSNIAGDFYSKNNLSEKRRIAERTRMEQEEDRQDKLSGMKESNRRMQKDKLGMRAVCSTCGSPKKPQLICHDCESPELWE